LVFVFGWKWSKHVGKTSGVDRCEVDHVGMVFSGRAGVRMRDGREAIMRTGDVFAVPPGDYSCVESDEPHVSLRFPGDGEYAA
jgi:hypothetical protein